MIMLQKTLTAAVTISFLIVPWAAAQVPGRPAPNRAPLILATLDSDGDQRISRSEAPNQLKQNFTLIDRNSDGGIDLTELRAILKLAANQSGSNSIPAPQPPTATSVPSADGPGFGTLNTKQAMRMQSVSPEQDRPFYMLNLIRYRAHAVYRDGRETKLTGRQANSLYAPVDLLTEIGAQLAYVGEVTSQGEGSQPDWESVAIVRYPSRARFLEMLGNRNFQARAVHKEAGVELTQVVVTERASWDASWAAPAERQETANAAANGDAPFMLCHLVKYRDEARYPDGHNAPKRSGREAMELYLKTAVGVLRNVGATPMLRLKVEGVFVGDGREWSECRLIQFPSQRAFREAAESELLRSVQHHRTAAIEDSYMLHLSTQIDRTAQIDSPGPPR